ncbi:RCC1 domain-containing protein 1 isoform X3 [Eschrichtius robustus]|uniref:RCC1 domain-containing protein 1 isoform X3 n=1 Tax=Eschrichtius robustus TaxID=9764 RepID=UPI0035C23460
MRVLLLGPQTRACPVASCRHPRLRGLTGGARHWGPLSPTPQFFLIVPQVLLILTPRPRACLRRTGPSGPTSPRPPKVSPTPRRRPQRPSVGLGDLFDRGEAASVYRKASGRISSSSSLNPPSRRPPQPGRSQQRALPGMAEERRGAWFGFGFCGFGQALGSGRGRQVHSPEPLRAPGAGLDVCRVSASWSYTAFVTRERPPSGAIPTPALGACPAPSPASSPPPAGGGGQVELSGFAIGAVGGCRDAWASEELLVVLRAGPGPGAGTELQAWAPGSALRGEPLWAQTVPEAEREDGPGGDETQAGPLPLLPCARAYVSPRPPFYRPLAPTLRARRLELGAEHALLLDAAGQVFSWGGGRHGQLGHGTLEAEPEPRLLQALQGLTMAEVAAGGWHSLCVSEHRLQMRKLSNCGSWAQPLRGMRDPPRPGLEPVLPALAGRPSTTAPPGKPKTSFLKGLQQDRWQRLGIFISGAGMNQGSWPCPPRAWQRMERQPQKEWGSSTPGAGVNMDSLATKTRPAWIGPAV